MKLKTAALSALLLGVLLLRADAYIDTCPSLGAVVGGSVSIVELQVDKVSVEKRAVIYKKVADLKGTSAAEPIRHAISDGGHPREPRAVLDWARPGRSALGFQHGKVFLVFTGTVWYESAQTEGGWWTMTRGCPEMLYSYAGSLARLKGAVAEMLAGKEVIVTALSYGGTPGGVDFTTAIHYRSSLRGVPYCRLKAGLKHTTYRPAQVVAKTGGTEEDVPPLLKALDDADAAKRADAAEDLGRIGPTAKSALTALSKRLKDSDARVRLAAAGAIAFIDPQHAELLPALTAELKGEVDARRAVAEILGDAGAVSALRPLLKDADGGVRWNAAESLGRLGPRAKDAVGDLTASLLDPEVRSIAADALGSVGVEAKSAVPALTKLVREEKDASLRRTAGLALIRIDVGSAGPAAPLLAEGLKHADGRVKHDSIILLHKLGAAGREATSVLSAQLKDPDETVRRFSADAMGWTKDPAGVPALVEAMRGDKNGGVRGTAAQALGMIGPDAKSSVPALEAALKDEDIGVRMFSAESLWKVAKDTEKSVPVLVQALYWKNTYHVGVTAGMLGRMGANAKSAVPELLKMLKEGDEIRRKVAADLLKTIDPKAASEAGVK